MWRIFCSVLFFFITTLPTVAQISRVKSLPASQRYTGLYAMRTEAPEAECRLLLDSLLQYADDINDAFLRTESYIIFASSTNEGARSFSKKRALFNEIWPHIQSSGDEESVGFYYQQLGRAYFNEKNFDSAFRYIVRATDIFERLGFANLRLGALYAGDLFNFYIRFEDYPFALKYAQLSVALNDTFPGTLAARLNDIGFTYLKMKDYPNAAATFKKVMAANNRVYLGIGSANYGNTLRLQGQYAQALPYLYAELETVAKDVPEDCAITSLYIADCLLHLDSMPKAKSYIGIAATFYNGLGIDERLDYSDYKLHYAEVAAHYYQKTKKYETASQYQQDLLRIKDSLKNLFSTQLLMATTLREKEEKMLASQQKADQKAAHTRLVRNVAIAFLTVAFLIALYLINEKRKKERRQQQELRREAERKLHQAQAKMEQYISNIKEKNAFIEKIEQELVALQPVPQKEGGVAENPRLEQLYEAVILTDEDWASFKQLCEQVWPGLFARLNEKYPGLNRSEERLLALGKLDISSKEMAGMVGISVESLRKSRYRLRKKYPALSEDAEFGSLL